MERATPRTRNASANPWVRQMQCVSPPLGKPANSRPPALGSPLLKGTSPVAAGAEIDTVPARPGAKDTPPTTSLFRRPMLSVRGFCVRSTFVAGPDGLLDLSNDWEVRCMNETYFWGYGVGIVRLSSGERCHLDIFFNGTSGLESPSYVVAPLFGPFSLG